VTRDDLDRYVNTLVMLHELIHVCEDNKNGIGPEYLPALKHAFSVIKWELYGQIKISEID